MAFDASLLQYIEDEDWRVLTAVEIGQRNHELVATELISTIAGLRGTVHHFLGSLLKNRLISHEGKPYDGYQLTKVGYDFLALHTLTKRGTITHLGPLIGQGKEADVYVAYDAEENPVVIKFHRIGRVSFRKAKDSRDYLSNKHTSSWLYLSRLSAQREYSNMQALQNFPIPRALDCNRHAVVMSLVDGTLLNNITSLNNPAEVFEECVHIFVNLLKVGVVHADFSQYNIIVSSNEETGEEKVTLIDFPQCMKHTSPEAEEKFNHDVEELRRFFSLKFDIQVETVPQFADFVDQIEPIELYPKKNNRKADNEEEDEEEDDPERAIAQRVSKENRFRRKPKKKNATKTMSKLKKEAQTYY